MGWWDKAKKAVVGEPEYSEAGTHLYILLTQRVWEWVWVRDDRIRHEPSGLLFDRSYNLSWFHDRNNKRICEGFTKDDRKRLVPAAKAILDRLSRENVTRTLNAAVGLPAPKPTLDPTAKSLCEAYLRDGDTVAVRALVDRLVEIFADGQQR